MSDTPANLPSYDALVAQHKLLTEKRIQVTAEHQAAQRRLQEAEKEAIEKCGTADPKALKALYDERTTRNAEAIAQTAATLNDIRQRLAEIDATATPVK